MKNEFTVVFLHKNQSILPIFSFQNERWVLRQRNFNSNISSANAFFEWPHPPVCNRGKTWSLKIFRKANNVKVAIFAFPILMSTKSVINNGWKWCQLLYKLTLIE